MPSKKSQFSRKRFLTYLAAGTAGSAVFSQLLSVNELFAAELKQIKANGTFRDNIQSTYMLSPDITYLNHASIGTIPKIVFDARSRYLQICESNPWLYMWSGEWSEPREASRKKISQLVNCSVDEIAFTHNTTEVFNILANGLPIGPGDEVLFSNLNHVGASMPFRHRAADRGFIIKEFDFPLANISQFTKEEIINAHAEQITKNTKLLVIPHIDNTVGLRHPIKEISRMAKSMGVQYVAVDGAQTIGMIPVDIQKVNVDVYATSAHKWIQAPKGVSFSYFSTEIQDQLRPMWVTWGQNRKNWVTTARRYEDYGTRNLAEVLTLGNAVDFITEIDSEVREQYLHSLWRHARDLVRDHKDLSWRSPVTWDMSGSLFAVEVTGRKSGEIFNVMYPKHGYVFRAFDLPEMSTMRISPNVINTKEEIDTFFSLVTATR